VQVTVCNREIHLKATERHLPYGITHLPLETVNALDLPTPEG